MNSSEKKKPAALKSKKSPLDDKKSMLTASKSKAGKKLWSGEALRESLKPSKEESKFREEKLKEKDILLKSKKYFRCTKCLLNFNPLIENKQVIPIHPIIGVLMCQKCCDYYEDGEFSLDSDGEDKYCRWCGEGGTIFGCAQCISGFCATCIKRHFENSYYKKVQNDDNWVCFFCNPKPLWFLRFICSLAIKQSEGELSTELNTSKNTSKESSTQQSSSSECSQIKLPKKRKSIRKHICISSSDESEQDEQQSPQKKLKLTKSPVADSSNNNKTIPNDKESLSFLEELEKVLKLSENQLKFGATCAQKMLAKLKSSNFSLTDIAKECQKIKWFLSLLSTYLVQFCNSVNSIEKKTLKGSRTKDVTDSNESTYITILQFLGFINTQVKTFMEKGIDLSDIIEAEIYDDENIIGIKKKLSSKTGSFKDKNTFHFGNKPNSTSNENEESTEELRFDSEGRDKSDNSLDIIEDQNSEVNSAEFDKEHNCSNTSLVGAHDLRTPDPEEDIQEILAILENA